MLLRDTEFDELIFENFDHHRRPGNEIAAIVAILLVNSRNVDYAILVFVEDGDLGIIVLDGGELLLVDVVVFVLVTQVYLRVRIVPEGFVGEEGKERRYARAAGNEHGVGFVVRLCEEFAKRKFEPHFPAHCQGLFHLLREVPFHGVSDADDILGRIALHGETARFRPLSDAVVLLVNGDMEKLPRGIFVRPF